MVNTRRKASAESTQAPKRAISSPAARGIILGGIGKPHKNSAKKQKSSFKNFLERLEARDIKLQESDELVNPQQYSQKVVSGTSKVEEVEWEVEEIIDSAFIDKQVHFLVLWKGHFIEASTWEPEKSLEHCKDVVNDFFVAFPKKSGAPGVKPRGRGVKPSE